MIFRFNVTVRSKVKQVQLFRKKAFKYIKYFFQSQNATNMNKTLARENRMTQRLATASKLTFAKNTVFMIINIQAQYKLKNNIVRAN